MIEIFRNCDTVFQSNVKKLLNAKSFRDNPGDFLEKKHQPVLKHYVKKTGKSPSGHLIVLLRESMCNWAKKYFYELIEPAKIQLITPNRFKHPIHSEKARQKKSMRNISM